MADSANLTYEQMFDAVTRLPRDARRRMLAQLRIWESEKPERDSESTLIRAIQCSAPKINLERYAVLRRKLEAETLSSGEHRELTEVIDQFEVAHAARMKLVVQLAKLRGETLDQALESLDLNFALPGVVTGS